jgi:TRAP-type C4-dicarboxylate transport system permease small subunit
VEVSSYVMLYITFLCVAWLQAKNGHVQIDLFTSKLGSRARAGLDAFTSLGAAAIGFILAWKGAMVTIDYYRRDVTVMSILNTPQFLLMAIIPVGGTLLVLVSLLRIRRSIRAVMQTNGPSQEGAS